MSFSNALTEKFLVNISPTGIPRVSGKMETIPMIKNSIV